MAGEPKKRHSKQRKRTRRAAIKLSPAALVVCKNCGKLTRPHTICQECGFYGGKTSSVVKKVHVTKGD